MRCIGSCEVNAAGAAYLHNSGLFGALTHTGAGDYTIALNQPLDALESVFLISIDNAYVASSMVSYGHTRAADNSIRVTTVQEQAGGAASIAADINFSVVAYSMRGENAQA